MAEYFIVVMFGCWVAATVGLQLPGVRPWLRKRDVALLLPEYRFFAPRPAQGDFHLVFRDLYADGTSSQWTEVCSPVTRRLSQALWHPDKRDRKALFDLVVQLNRLHFQEQISVLETTTPYLLILSYVAALRRTPQPNMTQFMIVASYGWWSNRPPEPVLVSRLHRL